MKFNYLKPGRLLKRKFNESEQFSQTWGEVVLEISSWLVSHPNQTAPRWSLLEDGEWNTRNEIFITEIILFNPWLWCSRLFLHVFMDEHTVNDKGTLNRPIQNKLNSKSILLCWISGWGHWWIEHAKLNYFSLTNIFHVSFFTIHV